MRIAYALILGVAACCCAQTKPIHKKVPLYKTVMICPKGQKLYVRQQSGFEPILSADGTTTNAVQMLYEWRAWDGEMPLFTSESDTATCFKGVPPPTRGTK